MPSTGIGKFGLHVSVSEMKLWRAITTIPFV
jgi:hypothetical protein